MKAIPALILAGLFLTSPAMAAKRPLAEIFAKTCLAHLPDFAGVDGSPYDPFVHSKADPHAEPGVPFITPEESEFWITSKPTREEGFALQVVEGTIYGKPARGCAIFGSGSKPEGPEDVLPGFDKIRSLGGTKGRLLPTYRHWTLAMHGHIVILSVGWAEGPIGDGNLYISVVAPDSSAIEALADDIVKDRAPNPPVPGVE